MTYIEMLQNPNLFIEAPIGMKDVPLQIQAFQKVDEEGNLLEEYYTPEEVVILGGHTINRVTTDGSKFIKGFCFSMDTIDELRAMMPQFNLVYGVDVKLHNIFEAQAELAKPEWNSDEQN